MMLPFALSVAIASVSPFPSKVCLPTSPKGPANGGGAPAGRIVPVAVYPKLLCRVAFEHPFSPALAVGATARARAITAAMVRDFVTVLPFMVISFVFIKWRSLRDNPSSQSCHCQWHGSAHGPHIFVPAVSIAAPPPPPGVHH